MAASLAHNSYGKSRIRMVKLLRDGARHDVREITANIALEGEFTTCHTEGDNCNVLPTDTMKNTVYALGKDDPLASIESFALRLGRHFLAEQSQITSARVEIIETPWQRLAVAGAAHPHTFTRAGEERAFCIAHVKRGATQVRAGLRDLVILKSTDSAFKGYIKDRFTTLKETDDRIMATSVTATWTYTRPDADFTKCRETIRAALVNTFAAHKSLSVQHTLYAMGEAALAACDAITEISLSLPNKHCLLVDLSPFKITNDNEIFLPIEEPHGLIEATIRRS